MHLLLGLALTCVAVADPELPRVGRIIVVGNTITSHSVIINAVQVEPGEILDPRELRAAETRLTRLGIFQSACVVVQDNPAQPASAFKEILVYVKETRTDSWRLIPGINRFGAPAVSLVWEERNFDPFRFPTDASDLFENGSFKGGGIPIRLEIVQFSLSPAQPICWLLWR